MKFATYKDGSRDGQLVVVSRDLSHAHFATGIATKLQQVLDDWNFLAPLLQDLSVALNHGKARHAFAFDPSQCMAPLPRAYQRIGGMAYLSHLELLRKARGVEMSGKLYGGPLLHQAGGDTFVGPCEPVAFADLSWDVDFEAQLVAVIGDVPRGVGADQALEGVRLLMLANDWSLRRLIPTEFAESSDWLRAKPVTAFGPVAVTPDELGDAWRDGRVHLPVQCSWNGRKVGHCDAGGEMTFHFGQLIACAATTRHLRSGALVSGGAISNKDSTKGYSCIVEKRALETLEHGCAKTDYLRWGDVVKIEVKGRDNKLLFGAIEQQVIEPD